MICAVAVAEQGLRRFWKGDGKGGADLWCCFVATAAVVRRRWEEALICDGGDSAWSRQGDGLRRGVGGATMAALCSVVVVDGG